MVDTKKKDIATKTARKSQKAVTEQVGADSATQATSVAKAGKRSAKAVKEAEGKADKEERKKTSAKVEKSRQEQKPPRSRAERAGKKYRDAAKLVDKEKPYGLSEALELTTKTGTTNFDSTVEIHLNLNVDPKQADQNIRGTVALPAGSGRSLLVAVFADGPDAAKAKRVGADLVGTSEVLAQLDKEQINFDVLVAPPAEMSKLGKYAKLLGPKGLMPNPKSGTVTSDLAKAVSEAKAGRVEYRVDAQSIIHLPIGRVSFGSAKLTQNAEAVLSSIRAAKPASVKGSLVKTAYLSTTMGPSIKIEV